MRTAEPPGSPGRDTLPLGLYLVANLAGAAACIGVCALTTTRCAPEVGVFVIVLVGPTGLAFLWIAWAIAAESLLPTDR